MKKKINISTALFDWRAEEERRRHREKTQRRKTGHIDLKGFSPYITVRSTLQPPLEREHVVNTSSSSQSLHFHWLHENTPSKVHMLLCKMFKKQRYLSPPEMSSTVISPISVPNKATTDVVPYHKANKM